MIDCRETQLQLAEYAAGDLCAAEAAEVARHLDGCPACMKELALENEMRATLGSLPLATCPPGVGDRTIESTPSRSGSRWPWGVGFAAAAGLAAMLIGGFVDRSPEPEWSEAEIAEARQDMIYTIGLAAEVLERTQRTAVLDVFGDRLPKAVTGSLKLKSPEQGEEG